MVAEEFCISVAKLSEKPEGSHEPKDDCNHHDNVEDTLDLAVHRQIVVDEVKNDPNNDQGDDYANERCHNEFLVS
jgi:hypothetical protein